MDSTQTLTQKNNSHSQKISEPDFYRRHIGPSDADISEMLRALGFSSLKDFVDHVVPEKIRDKKAIKMGALSHPISERECLEKISEYAAKNEIYSSFIGMGYYDTLLPTVILRNILENPSWYTQYTPYQPEISQGRLEALLNFQTLITDLTGFPLSNSSLLDEATAAAEAATMCYGIVSKDHERKTFVVDSDTHPQTLEVIRTRLRPLGLTLEVIDISKAQFSPDTFGVLISYPGSSGEIRNITSTIEKIKSIGAMSVVACDLMALTHLVPPAELGADVAIGSAQRFGVPFGYGGPHAAFFATKEEYKRVIPGRIVGVSVDAQGKKALRLALQTREQHIRREKATSNICTAQALLAVIASFYAIYHGPHGLRSIALKINARTRTAYEALKRAGVSIVTKSFFDTFTVNNLNGSTEEILKRAKEKKVALRINSDGSIGVSFDEAKTDLDVQKIIYIFTGNKESVQILPEKAFGDRSSKFLTHEVFNSYHSETELLRYMKKLESRELSLAHSMIPLGSCTMKLNATTEMIPITYPGFASIHPFAPLEHAKGYKKLFDDLNKALKAVTGFDGISFQPNAGSQGEYAGLLVIRAYQEAQGEMSRDTCLIPKSAHGTNPASAAMAGLKVVAVECDKEGNIDLNDLKQKIEQVGTALSCIMVTYPSTHGVFEGHIKKVSKMIHDAGGQVYLDGANLNALVGLVTPAGLGADVCHMNLHKTFCIPHGGGGPGMGPIGVMKHLTPFLPSHPVIPCGGENGIGPVSAAPFGSASILPISWSYMAMMGDEGVTKSTAVALLSANYIAHRLKDTFPVLYRGESGHVAHECILDLRSMKEVAGIEVDDISKRLIDYGFHAPTVSWPVSGTVMVEPTESESKRELDRFCDAMISIRAEIKEIEDGKASRTDNVLKNAPHTCEVLMKDSWEKPYSREKAAYPLPALRDRKFWPTVGRLDAGYGDRNLVCSCPSVEEMSS